MDPDTYEQEAVDQQLFGGLHNYFVENMQATLSSHGGEVVSGQSLSQSCGQHATCSHFTGSLLADRTWQQTLWLQNMLKLPL